MAETAKTGKAKMSFDEALALNCADFTGLAPVTSATWLALLTDVAESLFEWHGNTLDFFDRLMIERLIFRKSIFAMVQTQFRVGNAIVFGKRRIVECIPTEYGARNVITRIRLVMERPPENLIMEYHDTDFVIFDNFSLTNPRSLAGKYAEIMAKLDALYDQNINKLGIPIIGLVKKGLKNDLINLFKRATVNGLFALVNDTRDGIKANELFYDGKVEFILDKINLQRDAMMREYLQELGVNPNDEIASNSQYVNSVAIRESSLISKYFSASMNKYRDNFVDKVNARWPDENLSYNTTVKTYSEEVTPSGEIN